ncbi:LOW QUALITY PROTEIN: hypothetical protein TorRG33x02_232020 [Trema orientale]|uniref:Uncharacterized protein n=1 Tax=Trema orientale TaxID=63057 RepID=A0A2P5E608_TREOI|nr:LOW QUALITY PROTEIN: hypothetical protein TorRG33x02_232020 [Trema orientale]
MWRSSSVEEGGLRSKVPPILSCFLSHASNSEGDMGFEVEQLILKRAVYEEKKTETQTNFYSPRRDQIAKRFTKLTTKDFWGLRQSVGHAKAKQSN